MLYQLNLEDILFIDIETVPQYPSFDDVPSDFKKHWDKKSSYFQDEEHTAADVYERAGIYAEFGRIICISMGRIAQRKGERVYRVKSYVNDNEKQLLHEFINELDNFYTKGIRCLCAHNGQEFDYPYIARRCLINGLKLPKMLDIAGMKPWELKDRLIDTMQLWKFGDYKSFSSLSLLCSVFNIPTPKDDIDGSQVAHVFYVENDIERIIKYCEKDTLAVANLLLRYRGEQIIDPDLIEVIP